MGSLRNAQLAFSTLGTPDWTWPQILTLGPASGFSGVEIRLLERETDLLVVAGLRPQHRAQRRRELDDAGLSVCGLASSVRFDESGTIARARQLEVGRRYLELARDLGAKFVRVFGDVLPAEPAARADALAWIGDGMNVLAEQAASAGLEVLLETHGDFSDTRNVADLMSRVSSPAGGVLWDTHHPWRFLDEPVADSFARLRPWVRHTHWKDSVPIVPQHESANSDVPQHAREQAAMQAQQLMSGHRHADYVLFGEGEFPVDECLRLLASAEYCGWYCFEWEKMWHPELPDPSVALPQFVQEFRRRWHQLTSPGPGGASRDGRI